MKQHASSKPHQWTMSSPASTWTEALPLGNGHLGAMVHGGVTRERIDLNHDTFWSGYPDSWKDNPHYRTLPTPDPGYWWEAGDAALQQDWARASRILQDHLTGPYTESYLPLGALDLTIEHPTNASVEHYQRTLHYDTAMVTQSYTIDGFDYHREAFISYPDQVMVVQFTTDHPEGIRLTVGLRSEIPEAPVHRRDEGAEDLGETTLCYYQQAPGYVMPSYLGDIPDAIGYAEDPDEGGMAAAFAVTLIDAHGREVAVRAGDTLSIGPSPAITMLVAAETSFAGAEVHPWREGRPVLAPIGARLRQAAPYVDLFARHVADIRVLWQRMRWTVPEEDLEPMTEILQLFHFSRYLIIAGSRPGSQPTNLQGIWNDQMRAPWSANYTININTEMNYWGVEPLNLSDCHQPLLDKLPGLARKGRATARRYYGAEGAVAHHNTDLWNHTDPVGALEEGSVLYACWPLGLGWLCQHLYDHFAYTQDLGFLQRHALPVLKEASRFFLDTLREDSDGRLLMTPSTSPEHWFVTDRGDSSGVAAGTTMTQTIIDEVFRQTLHAIRLTGSDTDEVEEAITEALGRLHLWTIREDGALGEWDRDARDGDPQHRHISHLYGLYPGHQIRRDVPELAEAARRTLEIRGDEGTGWSLGWKILFHARLGDHEACERLIRSQLRPIGSVVQGSHAAGGSYPNLFSAHPPFQIDGNYASGAGIAAMFLDSRLVPSEEGWIETVVDVLPALPPSWGEGQLEGLRLRGHLEADLHYRHGQLVKLSLNNLNEVPVKLKIRYDSKERALTLQAGQVAHFGPEY